VPAFHTLDEVLRGQKHANLDETKQVRARGACFFLARGE
jgi:hypothetical protein